MRFFNKDGFGADEVRSAVGLISHSVDFEKWESVLTLAVRDVTAIIGRTPAEAIANAYEHDTEPLLVQWMQKAVAYFAWLKLIPTLDAQHDEAGRSRRLGENEKGLTALQEFKDEENIQRLAYEAVDMLVEEMTRAEFGPWMQSPKFRLREQLLIRSREEFDEFYNIGSSRLFVTLLPFMREVQDMDIAPVTGRDVMRQLLRGEELMHGTLNYLAAQALALLTMKKAVERLPIEVMPNGIVQVQQTQTVNQRVKAEREARLAVAASLEADAHRCLDQVSELTARINGTEPAADVQRRTATGPMSHSTGFSF